MRNWGFSWLAVLCLLPGVPVWGDSYAAQSVRATALGEGSPFTMSEGIKQDYLSQGQDFLRGYLRESMFRFLAQQGWYTNAAPGDTLAFMDLTSLYSQREDDPLNTQLRLQASDNLQRYLTSVPIKLELESSYLLIPRMQVHALLSAPFDDLLQLRLGSGIQWSDQLQTKIQYALCNGSQSYAGFSLGLNYAFQDWSLDLLYDLDPNFSLSEQISLQKKF